MQSFVIILIFILGLGPLFTWAFNPTNFEKYFGAPIHKFFGYDVLHSNQHIHSSTDFVTGLVWFLFVMFLSVMIASFFSDDLKLPTFNDYVQRFPGPGGRGAQCYQCNSTHLRNLGVRDVNDEHRVVRCGHCDTALYQTYR